MIVVERMEWWRGWGCDSGGEDGVVERMGV